MPANQCLSFLRSVYRRPCVDYEGLHNPVEQWLAAGGRGPPEDEEADIVSGRDAAVLAEGNGRGGAEPGAPGRVTVRALHGMCRGKIMALRWEDVNLEAGLFRVEETKTGVPLELPVTRQLGKILARRRAEWDTLREELGDWVFPSRSSESGHVEELHRHYEAIGRAGGVKFWFHALRNCFITVAERELMLPRSLTTRLVNHARPNDVTEGYGADWTVGQLREPAQRVADRIDELMESNGSTAHLHAPAR